MALKAVQVKRQAGSPASVLGPQRGTPLSSLWPPGVELGATQDA